MSECETPLKILHVLSGLDPRSGGTVSAMVGLAIGQAQAGLKPSVLVTLSPDESPVLAETLARHGIRCHILSPSTGPLRRHPDLVSTLRRLIADVDIVHVHAMWEEIQYQAARLAYRAGTPYVITPHGMLDRWSMSQRWYKKKLYLMLRMRRCLTRAAALHFATKAEADSVARMRLRPPSFIEPHGLDLTEFENLPAPGQFRAAHPQVGDRPFVLLLGRLHQVKGLDLLIPAFARGQFDDRVMLVLAGPCDADYRRQIDRMIDEHGIKDRMVFTGMLYDRQRIEAMVDAELFALPSYHENFGIAVIEALACRTPVVVSDQVAIHHEITEASVGSGVPTEVEPLATALCQWMDDAPRRHAAAEKAKPFVWRRYDWRQIGAHWVGHYERMVSPASRSLEEPQPAGQGG